MSARTRVLLYVPLLELGGAERQVERLACGLDRSRFEPIVAWSNGCGPIGARLRQAGIEVICLPFDSDADQSSAAIAIRELSPRIFHSFSYRRNAWDVLAAEAAGVPVVLTCRVNIREWDESLQVRDWEIVRNRATHRITAVSEAAAAMCAAVENIAREKIVVIYNGVEIPDNHAPVRSLREELHLPDDAQVLGYCGNYRQKKGHDVLMQAFRWVLDRRPRTHLVCCGLKGFGIDGRLEVMARELQIDDHLSLLDSRPDVDVFYRGVDLYVHPSLSEGFSNSILEAMSHSLPVVATAVGGNPEAVVEGVTGLLVPAGDPVALSEAIVTLVDDAPRRRTSGRAGFERIQQKFSVRAMVEGYESLYCQAVLPSLA